MKCICTNKQAIFFEFLKIAVEIVAGALAEKGARIIQSHGCFLIELLLVFLL